jgi:1,4-dihydroxy-2-naphthoate octaprenyltransferase
VQGPLVALGAYQTLSLGPPSSDALVAGVALGACAAAAVLAGDLADQPFDEAAGKRTLAVRLPPRWTRLLLRALAVVALLPLAFFARSAPLALVAATLLAAGFLALGPAASGSPRGLGAARAAAFALQALVAAVVVLEAA